MQLILQTKRTLKRLHYLKLEPKPRLLSTDRENTFRKECLHFYAAAASYLKVNLPFDISLFKHSQYLQPEKRNLSGSTNAISNLDLNVGAVLKNNISDISHVNKKEELCDEIRKQWLWYQNETTPEDFYLLSENFSKQVKIVLGVSFGKV